MSHFASRTAASLLRPPILRIVATLRWLLAIVPMVLALSLLLVRTFRRSVIQTQVAGA